MGAGEMSTDVSLATSLHFGDSEWKDLIPCIGFRNHVKAGIETIKEGNKKEELRQLHRNGLPEKTACMPAAPLRKGKDDTQRHSWS